MKILVETIEHSEYLRLSTPAHFGRYYQDKHSLSDLRQKEDHTRQFYETHVKRPFLGEAKKAQLSVFMSVNIFRMYSTCKYLNQNIWRI